MTESTEVKTIVGFERVASTRFLKGADARWLLHFTDGTQARIHPDSGMEFIYPEYRGKPVKVTFNGRRQILHIKHLGD